ncbi:MAG: hypothetical protein M1429_02475 [Patescibacteria group bacterium]|nr:hypothetical protein [Patescibacteria group bacterium]
MQRKVILIVLSLVVLIVTTLPILANEIGKPIVSPQPVDTIGDISQTNGERIRVNNVRIEKIWAFSLLQPQYFVVTERVNKQDYRLIVMASLPNPTDFQLISFIGVTVDVEGTLSMTAEGNRTLNNCTVYGYFDSRGRLICPMPKLPWGGEAVEWPNKQVISSDTNVDVRVQSAIQSAGQIQFLDTNPPGPSPNPPPAPIVCETIGDARTAYDTYYNVTTYPQVTVELQCKDIDNPVTGSPNHFTLSESNDSITVYTLTSGITATDRINKVFGTVIKDGSNYWIDVDAGPGWTQSFVPGNLQKVTSGTIAWAKTFPDNTTLPTDGRTYALEGLVVAERIYIYSETYATVYMTDTTGTQGLVVTCNLGSNVSPGSVHNLNGTMSRKYDIYSQQVVDRQLNTGVLLTSNVSTSVPRFRYTPIKNLFCGSFNKYSAGVYNGKGLNMLDLPVKIVGKITYVDPNFGYIYVDDGSNTQDGTLDEYSNPIIGIRVKCLRINEMTVGNSITVPGYLTTLWDMVNSRSIPLLEGTISSEIDPVVNENIIQPPANLTADSGNGKVYLSWDAAPGAVSYKIYRGWYWWDEGSQSWVYGWDSNWTPVVTSEIEYTDASVANSDWDTYGVYTLYGISSISANAIESAYLSSVNANPSAEAWSITIDHITEDVNNAGYVAINYTLTPGRYPAPENIRLCIDGNEIREYPIENDRVIVYDMSEYSAGQHAFELRVGESEDYFLNSFIGWDSTTFTVNQRIGKFKVSEYIGDNLPCTVTGDFAGQTSWSLGFYQAGSLVGQLTGSGTSLDTSWDGAGASNGSIDMVLTLTYDENGQQKVVKKRSATKKRSGDNSNHTNRMWCTNNLVNSMPWSSNNEWSDARYYTGLQLAQHYDYGNTPVLFGASYCNAGILDGPELSNQLGTSTFQVFNGGNDSDIDIWYLAAECRTSYYSPKKKGEVIWGYWTNSQTNWGVFGLTELGHPSKYTGHFWFVCPLCLLLGNSNHDHTGMHVSWSSLKNSLSAIPTGLNSWGVNTQDPPGNLLEPPVNKINVPLPEYRKFRIVVFSGIDTWRWAGVFGLSISGNYPGSTYMVGSNDCGKQIIPSNSRVTYQSSVTLDHCFIGFSQRTIITDDRLGNVKKVTKGTAGAISKFTIAFSKYMRLGHSAWAAIKLGYAEAEDWCMKNPGQSMPMVLLFGDPFTRMHHSTNLNATLD